MSVLCCVCRRTSMAYMLPCANKLACVPCSTMRPASMTMVESAERTVDSLHHAHQHHQYYCI